MYNVATIPEPIDAASWPGPSVVHVWTADINNVAEDADSVLPLLSSGERVRAERLISDDTRRRFIIVRGLLRRILSGYLDVAPETLAIATGARGKPALAGQAANTGLVFNLAHSKTSAVFAVGTGSDIGVDIERVGRERDALTIARRYFSRAEFDILSQVPAAGRDRAFLTCWTRKEAAMKAHGGGMAFLCEIEAGMEKVQKGIVIDIKGRQFTIRDLDGPTGCVGAVARAGEGFDVVQRSLD